MFSCPDDVRIELGMQMMRNCTINGLHILALEKRMVIRGREFQGRNILFEPAEGAFIRVARCRENGSSIEYWLDGSSARQRWQIPCPSGPIQ